MVDRQIYADSVSARWYSSYNPSTTAVTHDLLGIKILGISRTVIFLVLCTALLVPGTGKSWMLYCEGLGSRIDGPMRLQRTLPVHNFAETQKKPPERYGGGSTGFPCSFLGVTFL